jgi:hypothetical protein
MKPEQGGRMNGAIQQILEKELRAGQNRLRNLEGLEKEQEAELIATRKEIVEISDGCEAIRLFLQEGK